MEGGEGGYCVEGRLRDIGGIWGAGDSGYWGTWVGGCGESWDMWYILGDGGYVERGILGTCGMWEGEMGDVDGMGGWVGRWGMGVWGYGICEMGRWGICGDGDVGIMGICGSG